MARQLRIQFKDAYYHITSRGNERQNIFKDDKDYIIFLNKLKDSVQVYNINLLSYVCMKNHFHLLLSTPEGNLSDFMRHFNISYTSAFNRRYNRSGHLYQGRYKSFLIDADNYLQEVCRYIHLNPVRIKKYSKKSIEDKIKIFDEFKFSSFSEYLNPKLRKDFLNYSMVLDYFGGDNLKGRSLFKKFVYEGLGNINSRLLDAGKGTGILGGDNFIDKIKDKYLPKTIDKNKREVPGLRSLKKKYQPDELIELYCNYFKIEGDFITTKGKNTDNRSMIMELLYRYCDLTQPQIGEIVGGIDYSSVSYSRKRLRLKLEKDVYLKRKFSKIDDYLSRLKI